MVRSLTRLVVSHAVAENAVRVVAVVANSDVHRAAQSGLRRNVIRTGHRAELSQRVGVGLSALGHRRAAVRAGVRLGRHELLLLGCGLANLMRRQRAFGIANVVRNLAKVFLTLDVTDGNVFGVGMCTGELDVINREIDIASLQASHAERALVLVLTGNVIKRAVLHRDGHLAVLGRLLHVHHNAGDHAVEGAAVNSERTKAVDGDRPAVRCTAGFQERAVLNGNNDPTVAGAIVEQDFMRVLAANHIDGYRVVGFSRAPHGSAAVQIVDIDRNILGQRVVVLNIPLGSAAQSRAVAINGRVGHIAGMRKIAIRNICVRTAVNHSLVRAVRRNNALVLLRVIQQLINVAVEVSSIVNRRIHRPDGIVNPSQRSLGCDISKSVSQRCVRSIANLRNNLLGRVRNIAVLVDRATVSKIIFADWHVERTSRDVELALGRLSVLLRCNIEAAADTSAVSSDGHLLVIRRAFDILLERALGAVRCGDITQCHRCSLRNNDSSLFVQPFKGRTIDFNGHWSLSRGIALRVDLRAACACELTAVQFDITAVNPQVIQTGRRILKRAVIVHGLALLVLADDRRDLQ